MKYLTVSRALTLLTVIMFVVSVFTGSWLVATAVAISASAGLVRGRTSAVSAKSRKELV